MTTRKQRIFALTGGDEEAEEDVGVGDVVVEITITKINSHTRVDAGDVDHMGDVAVQIKVCNLTTMETHPMELIGWRISSINQGFMPRFRQNKRPGCFN